jgi:hypothetical protein
VNPQLPQNYPGYPPPPGPPPGGRKRGVALPVILISVVTLVILAVIGTVGYSVVQGRRHPHTAASHHASRSASASASPTPTVTPYTQVADPCSLTGLPAQLKSVKSEPFDEGSGSKMCRWESYQSSGAADLEVRVKTDPGSDDQVSAAHQLLLGDEKGLSADTNEDVPPNPQPLTGLGDEAYSAAYDDEVVTGPDENHTVGYYFGGATVEARSRNVIVEIEWGAATYSTPSANPEKGTNLTPTQATQQATTMIKTLFGQLK